ncbi:MAG: UpxY family transcription antiterminator, partial [Turneriella sp.]|nr:UpxY family transcription antiterminator [Turneriella sp.]
MADANEPQWYAVYTKPRAEKKLREHLARHAIEHYLPLVRRRKKWSDRYKWVEEPVFSSYVFVKIAASERLRVLRLPHAVYIVSRDNAPLPIAEETITLLRIAVDRFAETLTVRSSNDIASGERVRVIAGPFAGHEATVLS